MHYSYSCAEVDIQDSALEVVDALRPIVEARLERIRNDPDSGLH